MQETLDGSTQAALERMVLEMHDTTLTRYLTTVGMVLMLYDHVLTLSAEVWLVWNARPSFAKALFLFNRYLVVVTQVCVAVFMNHFGNDDFTKASCQGVVTVALVLGICSVACANVLVILRVIILWDRDYRVALLMALGFFAAFFTSVSFMISILHDSYGGFEYLAHMHTCTAVINSSKLLGVWVSMMVFEVLVLISVFLNALYRPRGHGTPLRRVLLRDGIFFFTSLTGLQLINLMFSTAARPTLHTSGVFFVWALTTLVLNRSLLNIHKASTPSRLARQRSTTGGTSTGSVSVKTSVQSHSYSQSYCNGVSPVPARTGVRVLSIVSISTEHGSDSARCSLADTPVETRYEERVTSNRRLHEHEGAPRREGADAWGIELESRTSRVH